MAESGTKERIYQTVENNQSKIINGILVVGGIYLTYRLGKKMVDGLNKSDAQSKADDSPDVRQAMELRSAMNPSGISWMMSFDTTNKSTLMDVTKTITNLDNVSKAYKNLYQDNLLDDLQGELSAEDYQKFLTIVSSNQKKNSNNGGSAPVQFVKANQLVVAKKEVALRSSPDATNHGAFYEVFSKKNIIRYAKVGEFLGYATGRQYYDEVNNVKFIEVAYVINGVKAPASLKSKNKQRMSFWVSSSINFVEVFSFFKNMYDAYPKTMSDTGWMKPVDFFTLKGIPMPRLLTKARTPILNERLIAINVAEPNTMLGQFIMSLNTGRGEFFQFRTVDNTIRWVDKRFIQLQDLT
jgi:hypothetical protein